MKKNKEWLDPLYLDSFFTDEERSIKENTVKFCKEKLIPNVIENNNKHYFDIEIYKEFGKMGFLGPNVIGYGSAEVNKVSYGIIASEIEAVDSSYRSAISVQSSLVCYPIEIFGSEEQKNNYLPDLIKGNLIGCFGLTEAEAGSDPSSMKTNYIEKKITILLMDQKTG